MKYSFVVALYNAENYIEECLKSMLAQTFQDFEIIIVNDGSKDNSKQIVEKYADGKKVKLINQLNSGCGGARNTAIKAATGEYIVIVDADDLVRPELLENLNKSNSDIIKYRVKCIEEDTNDRFELPLFENLSSTEALLEFCKSENIWATPWGSAIKRNLFIENEFFFESRRYHEDFGLMPRLYLKANNVSSISYLGYYYIKRPNSMTTITDRSVAVDRARDFMFHFINNHEYIKKKSNLSKIEKDIIIRYFTERFLIKLINFDIETQKFIMGDRNETFNGQYKTR